MAAPERAARVRVPDRVPSLLTDLYQFTMAYGYWSARRHEEPAAFELFFRSNPFQGGFALFCGLRECTRFLGGFRLSEEEVRYLRSALPPDTHPDFFSYLRRLDCSGVTVRAVPEGSAAFARVPLMEVSGPLAVVQLLESSLLCLVNYASLVCTNAARFRLAAGPKLQLLEMGLRRAQGPDGSLTASLCAYIGGFNLTTNVQAGYLFGIPLAGTIGHSYITSFSSLEEAEHALLDPRTLVRASLSRVCHLLAEDRAKVREGELAAFVSYAAAYPSNFLPVIDSYSMASGLLSFCAVALSLCELGYKPRGVRLDSGDLCRQSVEVRRVFRTCAEGFGKPDFLSLSIVGTNNISECNLEELSETENEIDAVGVGTHLVTCTLQPSLGCVYKLVEVAGRPTMKVTEDPEKSTMPGRKGLYRLLDARGHPALDLLCVRDEPPPREGVELRCHLLGQERNPISVTPAHVVSLWRDVFVQGQVLQPPESVREVRERAQRSLDMLHPRHKRLRDPDAYPVSYPVTAVLLLFHYAHHADIIMRTPTKKNKTRCLASATLHMCIIHP
uniref:Nicotinate phosphoribosyltransferase n=1 Tax=Scleropages formosus TaxID=113540 RepID=A0A8C9T869_SCLFO